MKKVKIALLALIATVLILPACKKGADDPFLSLRSRDGRMEGNWTLSAVSGTHIDYATTNTTTTDTYNGSVYTSTTTGSSPESATGTYTMVISKHGVVTWSSSIAQSGSSDVQTGTGEWYWSNSDKNKEFFYIDGAGSNGFFPGGATFYVDKCSHSTMILESNRESITNGVGSSDNFTFTFTRQ